MIDAAAPVVTVDTLLTNDNTPELTGTVNDPSAVISVTVAGNTYGAVNNGDGTWTLADDTISPALSDGTYDVQASATDLSGNTGTDATTDELTIETTPGPQPLLSEDFNDGDYNGWTLVEQGTIQGPMAWSAVTGVMVQSSNVYSSSEISKLGTYAYWQAGSGWTDYTATVTIKSDDDDGVGIMFRYQDGNNYYRFIWDRQRNSRALAKCESGQFTILDEDSVAYVSGRDYQVKISVQGSTLQVFIDGSQVLSADDSTISSGTIALYCWGNMGSYFDDILVEGPSVSNQAPDISSVTASPSTISETETSQLQVNATDPDNDPLVYSWSVQSGEGSLSDSSIDSPVYTPPDVSGSQTFTLTVEVSDGTHITSQTVDITVIDDAAVVNDPPTVALANTVTALGEDADTTARIKVADIVVTDDALGTNNLSLSGNDAGLFEIDGTELYLMAGASLDHETNPTLDVTIEVDDAAVGADPDDTASLIITVTDIVVDPKKVGNTDVFGSTTTAVDRRAQPVTMTEDGTITSISIYHQGGTGDILLGVYADSGGLPGSRLAVTASTPINVVAGWQTVDLLSPVDVSAGSVIWLAWVFESNPGIRYEAGTPGRAASGQGWSGGMPSMFGSAMQSGYIYSIYAIYYTGNEEY